MKTKIFTALIGLFVGSNALCCQYGIGWSRTAKGLVKTAYGAEANNLETGEIHDRSFYLFTRPNGVNCPDQIRAITTVSFNYNEKACEAKIILKGNYDACRIKHVRCHKI